MASKPEVIHMAQDNKGDSTLDQLNYETGQPKIPLLSNTEGQASSTKAKEDGVAFWTRHTKPVLTSLLKNVGNYTAEQQASHLKFLDEYIIPSMGRAPDKSCARSLLTHHGSPFETSLNHSDNGKSYVRFCYEPVVPGSDGVTKDPIPAIAEKVGADLRWFNQFAAEFFPSATDEAILREKVPKDTMRIPKVFLAFDLQEDERTMKAYFYPIIKYMTTKHNSDRAGFDLIRRLDPLGPSFGPALDLIEDYQDLLYQDPPLTVVIGIDCVKPEDGARIKIYIEPQSNTWEAVRRHVTLGGKLTDKTTLDGLAILRDMWNLMIDEPEDKEIDDHFSKETLEKKPGPSGACFSWELKPGQVIPDVKIYVPLSQYFKSDKAIVEALEKVFRKRGWAWGVEGAYRKIISDAYGSDVIDDEIKTPTVHTFVSFSFSEKKGAYMTTSDLQAPESTCSILAMDNFNKRFTTSDGDTYAYDYVPAKGDRETFLLIHGYPSSRHDWRFQVADLTEAGYGVIAPDCLGYGDSDKRIDIEAYRLKRLSGHFAELLDHEKIDKVVGVSHDWGSMVLSRVVVWHPERFHKLVFMSAGYTAPGVFFDVDGLNVMSQSQLGYMQLGYWYFFNSYDAERLIVKNLESFFHLAYPADPSIWVKYLAAINGTREWLTAGKTGPLPPWLTEEDKARWLQINSQENTIAASLNYYRSLMRGTQAQDEDALTDAQRTLGVPVLGICGSEDMVTRADQIGRGIRPYASQGYTEMVLEGAGHWVMLERRKEVSSALLEFVRAT